MRRKAQKTLRQLVLEAVLAGATTCGTVVKKVGGSISAATAITAFRRRLKVDKKRKVVIKRHTLHEATELGKSVLVRETLGALLRQGKIARVSWGVYGPPQPKLHQPPLEQSA